MPFFQMIRLEERRHRVKVEEELFIPERPDYEAELLVFPFFLLSEAFLMSIVRFIG